MHLNLDFEKKFIPTLGQEVMEVKRKYLAWESDVSTSSTIKGPEKSKSSKSSWKDNLLELLENPMRVELLEDRTPEKRPESSLLSLNTYKVYMNGPQQKAKKY